jgi:hypothetical protein
MPTADSTTDSGTPSMPATMLRMRIKSVYETRPISAVSKVRPVNGTRNAKRAMLGIV